jgi:hypothetical protein
LYHSSNNIQSAASVDVPGFGEPRKSACVVFYLCLLSVQYAQQLHLRKFLILPFHRNMLIHTLPLPMFTRWSHDQRIISNDLINQVMTLFGIHYREP